MLVQAFPIVGANRTDSDRGAVEHPDLDTIFLRVDQHVAIFSITANQYARHRAS